MENCTILPKNHKEILHIDLQKNKKLAVFVNISALVIMVIMLIPVFMIYSFSDIRRVVLDAEINFLIKLCLILPAMIVYIISHELVHGIFMKKFSGIKPKYGYTKLYAFAGSDAYFNRKCYIIISLAPIVLLGIALAVLQLTLPSSWGLFVYLIQIMNISGAAGDLYVTYKMSKMPDDILVLDSGVSMNIYSGKK